MVVWSRPGAVLDHTNPPPCLAAELQDGDGPRFWTLIGPAPGPLEETM